jgi:hypothetical protein
VAQCQQSAASLSHDAHVAAFLHSGHDRRKVIVRQNDVGSLRRALLSIPTAGGWLGTCLVISVPDKFMAIPASAC